MKPLLLLLALVSVPCLAKDGQETGNGGDPVAIEFMTRAFEAAVNIRSTPAGYSDLQNIDILGILDQVNRARDENGGETDQNPHRRVKGDGRARRQ